jgi:CRISPR-associated protein Csh2
MGTEIRKSEILFLYETSYNIPNGDPFTGEQRYDDETKKILVSDVRIKRFIRTYLEDVKNLSIYVSEKTGAGKTDSKNVLKWLAENKNEKQSNDIGEILKQQIDVRLFGGISTLDDKLKIKDKEYINGHVQFTGPVQFALLNPSLNEVDLRMHQNTTHFTSNEGNTQGSIGTTTLVPYSLMQIHGWINPKIAETTGLTPSDLKLMYEGLWYGTSGEGSSFSRSKVGQNSVLLVEIVYAKSNKIIYGADRLISIKSEKKGETIRCIDDYDLDITKLTALKDDPRIEKVRFYTEIPKIEEKFKVEGEDKFLNKFDKMEL